MRQLGILILSAILYATIAQAQPYIPRALPFPEGLNCGHIPLILQFQDKLVFRGHKIINDFGHERLLLYDGKNPVQTIPDSLMGDLYLEHLVWIHPQPQDKLYFVARDTPVRTNLYTWDGINPVEKLITLPKGSTLSSGIKLRDSIYYLFIPSKTGKQSIFVLDVNSKLIENITPDHGWIRSMYLFQNKLYFFENDKPELLYCYNPATGKTTEIPTGLQKKENAQYIIHCHTEDKMFFVIKTITYGAELYEFDGSSPLRMITDFALGKADGVSSIALPHNGKIYFAGKMSDTTENYDLYSYDIQRKQIRLVIDFSKNKKIKYAPSYLTIVNNKIYFTLYRDDMGGQLYNYSLKTKKLTQLTKFKDKKTGIFLYPVNLFDWKKRLYFSPFPPDGMDNADGLFLGPNLTEFAPIYSIPIN